MSNEREQAGQLGTAGMAQAVPGRAGAAQTIRSAGHLDGLHKNLCDFRDRLRDCNNGMRDHSTRITGTNPIPSDPPDEAPKPEGILHAMSVTMGDIERQLQDYEKVVQHFNSL
ncbi:MAG: hypothetical protein O7D34_05245 [Ignavibacteria bacterium]|nr:hypothetical protein [Ignavibacteria bacterium]